MVPLIRRVVEFRLNCFALKWRGVDRGAARVAWRASARQTRRHAARVAAGGAVDEVREGDAHEVVRAGQLDGRVVGDAHALELEQDVAQQRRQAVVVVPAGGAEEAMAREAEGGRRRRRRTRRALLFTSRA